MKCKKCENIHKDPNSGMMICLTCGTVHEECQIVEALEFDDNQNAAGTFLDINKPTYFPGGRSILGQMIDSSQRNLNKVYKKIEKTARILTIKENVVNRAKFLYNKVLEKNKKFTQGRKTDLIVGAILYLACREEGTEHLLIDFSEVLSINVFVIGCLYIKLLKLLGLNNKIKIIDLSLFMRRFCNKFNLGNKAKKVERTAIKILQFMKRDWITSGRRPSGLCGACILISAKLHKLNIDINNISRVVHVCNQTILNRIDEFSLTRVASMTMEEFEIFEKSHFYPGADPPAFLKSIKERNEEEEKKKEEENGKGEEFKEKKIENGQTSFDRNNNEILSLRAVNSGLTKHNNNESFCTLKPLDSELTKKKNNSFFNDKLNLRSSNSGLNKNNNYNGNRITKNNNDNDNLSLRPVSSRISKNNYDNDNLSLRPGNSGNFKNNYEISNLSLRPNNSGINRSTRFNDLKAVSIADEKLSNIPDNEDYKYIYNKDEYGVRKQFWEIMFKDWIEQQKEKEEKERKEKKIKVKEPKKRIKKMIIKSDETQRTPFEAIKSSNKFGRKTNYSYIRNIMSKRSNINK